VYATPKVIAADDMRFMAGRKSTPPPCATPLDSLTLSLLPHDSHISARLHSAKAVPLPYATTSELLTGILEA
jgi:hypothetical protein